MKSFVSRGGGAATEFGAATSGNHKAGAEMRGLARKRYDAAKWPSMSTLPKVGLGRNKAACGQINRRDNSASKLNDQSARVNQLYRR